MVKMFLESLKNLTSKPETKGYPYTPSPEPKGYKGTILYDEDLCIFCDKCEEVCPPGAILFEIVDVENNKREYSYNPYLCIYCHACVDACPKADEGCLVQSETRLPPLGRDSKVPKDKKLGYFVNRIEEAKDFDKKWDEFEERARESREKLAEHKKRMKLKKQQEAKAKKEAEAKAKQEAEAKAKQEAEAKQKTEADAQQPN